MRLRFAHRAFASVVWIVFGTGCGAHYIGYVDNGDDAADESGLGRGAEHDGAPDGKSDVSMKAAVLPDAEAGSNDVSPRAANPSDSGDTSPADTRPSDVGAAPDADGAHDAIDAGDPCASQTNLDDCNRAGCAWFECAEACQPQGTPLCQVCPSYPSCPGCMHEDASIPVGSKFCDPNDPRAEFVCEDPAAGPDAQFMRRACLGSQLCGMDQCLAPCGDGLFCAAQFVPGSALCHASGPSAALYCCPAGQQVLANGCGTCESITDLPACNDAGCAWFSCAESCRPFGTPICDVCPTDPLCTDP
jgi:hypothetical protein